MVRAGRWMLLAGGMLLVASAAAHALLGWPAIRAGLEQADVEADLVRAVGIGWHYGSGAMLAFGCLTLVAWRRARTDPAVARWVAATIAMLYLAFGAWAISRTASPHFLVFVALGAVLGAAAWALGRPARS